jgi:hypothetical protein
LDVKKISKKLLVFININRSKEGFSVFLEPFMVDALFSSVSEARVRLNHAH